VELGIDLGAVGIILCRGKALTKRSNFMLTSAAPANLRPAAGCGHVDLLKIYAKIYEPARNVYRLTYVLNSSNRGTVNEGSLRKPIYVARNNRAKSSNDNPIAARLLARMLR
jgi:hypothetical protein